ncbi:MAG: FISUMP domain-containing protein [Pseudomonadota bacterium]
MSMEDVYTHSVKGDKVVVKRGFSYPGFFFGFIWAFVKGLPGIGFALLAAIVGFRAFEVFIASIDPKIARFVSVSCPLVLAFAVGSMGNEWIRSKLIRKGYIHTAKIGNVDPDTELYPKQQSIYSDYNEMIYKTNGDDASIQAILVKLSGKYHVELDYVKKSVEKGKNLGNPQETGFPYSEYHQATPMPNSKEVSNFETVKLGNQEWLAENLSTETEHSWCYDNDSKNCEEYGRLYTWDAAIKACPEGWHLPTDKDWNDLIIYLGGEEIAGGTLKSSPSGLNLKLSGFRNHKDGSFNFLRQSGNYWSSSESNSEKAWFRALNYKNAFISRFDADKKAGFSVRYLKDRPKEG